jgi:predicted NAD/FAD-binding protein
MRCIAVDSSQNIYVTGDYRSTIATAINTFGAAPALTGVSMPIPVLNDGFVIKWNANGTLAGYSTIRGSGNDTVNSIAVDSSQNIYVTGGYIAASAVPINTFGTAPTATGVSLPISSGTDMFVIKWNANGTLAGYSTLKGTNNDVGYSIVVDSSQNIYVTGEYTSTIANPIYTFGTSPVLTGVSLPISSGDAFVIKWNANGTLAGYSTIAGSGSDVGRGIAIDSSQNIYITGQYQTGIGGVPIRTFGTSPALTGVSLPGASTSDMFVIKWNANGTLAGYSTFSGNNTDIGYGVAVDSSQNIYVTGQYTSSVTVPIRTFGTAPTATGVSLPISTVNSMFVIKWNANGTLAGYSTFGANTNVGNSIAVDSSQNIYVTGQYASGSAVPIRTFGTAPTATGFNLPITTNNDGFVIKWNANGTLAGYSPIKGSLIDLGRSIAVDPSRNIYVAGQYNSTAAAVINTFGTAPTASGISMPAVVGTDMFVIKWNIPQ